MTSVISCNLNSYITRLASRSKTSYLTFFIASALGNNIIDGKAKPLKHLEKYKYKNAM